METTAKTPRVIVRKNTDSLSVSIPVEINKALEGRLAALGMSKSSYITQLIRADLEQNGTNGPIRIVSLSAQGSFSAAGRAELTVAGRKRRKG